MQTTLLITLSLILITPVALADNHKNYQIDQKLSHVGFEIMKYKIGALVKGKFDRFSGSAKIAKGKVSGVSANIEVASINTENEKRDTHLRSPDFFDVARPANKIMSFRQSGTAPISARFNLRGDFTLKGVTKPIILNVQRIGKNHYKARTKINKAEYGVTWNRPLEKSLWKKFKGKVLGKTIIGEEIDIVLDIVLREKSSS